MIDATAQQLRSTPAAGLGAAQQLTPRLAARAETHDRDGRFPAADFADIRQSGLLGLMVPVKLGGAGAYFADYVEVAMALAAGNGATALIFNMHSSIVGALAHTSDEMARMLGASDQWFEHRDQLLRQAAAGAFFAVAMSERGAGSRLSAMTTTFQRVEDGFHIRGSKAFVSGAGHADGYLVAARSAGDDSADVSHFLVPAGDGVTVDETWDAMGMRATGSNDVHLDVVVSPDALLGGIEGLAIDLAQSMPQWLVASYAAVYVGVAQSALNAAVDHVNERHLAHLASVRSNIGQADAAVAAAGLAVRQAAALIDAQPGQPETNQWVYRAKLLAGETAMQVAASMLEVAGTSATRRGHPLERIFRDARCGALQPATSSVCEDWLGTAALGLSPELDAITPRW